MKKSKKILALGLALALVLGSMGNVFAYPYNGTNYDGIQVNDTFYSLGYITGNEGTFGDIFGPADSTKVILDFNQKAAKFSDYLAANPADFDAWASNAANQTPANPTKFVKADGTLVPVEPVEEELTVVDVDVLNRTTIEVEFSDGAIENFTVSALSVGTNTRTIKYEGKNFTVSVTYNPSEAAVKNIEFVNYRNVRVTFDDIVDHESAADASNYYFEIVDGNAAYGLTNGFPTLLRSNQLSMIDTEYPGGADAWWNGIYDEDKEEWTVEPNIVAKDVNGKTIVDIYLPEDARFTDVADNSFGSYPYGYNAADAERTLSVEQRKSKTDGFVQKLLTKDTVVNVAVRNVKDTDGQLTIDTAVMPIRILDTVKPELLSIDIIENGRPECNEPKTLSGLPRDLGSFDLLRTRPNIDQVGEALQFTYSEPVFDAHRLDMSDLDQYRDLTLYVNGKLVASLSARNLREFMSFEMSENGVYNDARRVTLDVEKAVWAAYDEEFATGKYYTIRFVGVTDLAGNLEVSSEHSFKVRFYDDPVVNPDPVTPEVLDVVQIADNIFRIEFNREDVKGEFVIENPDGEGYGTLKVDVPRSFESENGHFYSYVAVPARDHEPIDGVPTDVNQNEILAYDGQNEIYRNIRVQNIRVPERFEDVADYTLRGDDYIPDDPMTMVDDILAPVALNAEDVEYGDNWIISVPVEDVTPWVEDENAYYWVHPIAYTYFDQRFGNEILPEQDGADTYLPILVSYEDARGAIHEALVTNHDVKPENGYPTDLHEGYTGAITWDSINDELELDLSFYPELLDAEGNLVEGATYKVDIPKGYFTDSPKDTESWNGPGEFTFDGYILDMLYVDDARADDDYFWIFPIEDGLGFTSDEKTVYAEVEEVEGPGPDPEYVPQTSMQLINYDESTNEMRVEFTGTIDVSTLKDKDNYSFDGRTLAEWDELLDTNTEIRYVVEDDPEIDYEHQYAVFKIPQNSIQEYGNYDFTVSGVSHPDGGTMTPVETEVRLHDNYQPVVIEAKVTGDSQIMLTFNEPVRYFVDAEDIDAHAVANNFIVMVGDVQWQVDTAVLPGMDFADPDNDREIILNGTKLPVSGDITVEIVRDQNNNILVIDYSTLKNPMLETTYDVDRP